MCSKDGPCKELSNVVFSRLSTTNGSDETGEGAEFVPHARGIWLNRPAGRGLRERVKMTPF